MAESTLSIGYGEIREEIARLLSFDRAPTKWSGTQRRDVDRAMERGLRRFYSPQTVPDPDDNRRVITHTWSFLHPTTTIGVFAAPSGTLASDPSGGTTITANTSIFTPDDAATGAELVGQTITLKDVSAGTSETLTVASVTSATVIESTANVSANFASTSDTVSVSIDGNFNLPDNFLDLESDLTFQTETSRSPIIVTGQNQINTRRQSATFVQTDRPRLAAVRPRDTAGTTGQRHELMLWPKPDSAYTLVYRYQIALDNLTSSSTFPPGGLLHGETILQSCLAVAEEWGETPATMHRATYEKLLMSSVALDRKQHAEYLGYNSDESDIKHRPVDPRLIEIPAATYDGTTYQA